MQNSLGIYIEDNVIKYAKLQKDKDSVKVENCNIVFYEDNLDETIKKIISETYSYGKVPISINISNEIYNTFEISTLLNKKDFKKAVEIEYEMLCDEKGYSKSTIEHRYLLVDQKENPDKQKVLNLLVNKNEISKKMSATSGNKVATITPITTSILNLLDVGIRENVLIVNIESKTKITTIIDGQIYQIDVLDEGMANILEQINQVENSLPKSYEVCKNMTIYTQNAAELYIDTDEYMDVVKTSLYKIIQETKTIMGELFSNIDKIYITGLGTAINNIDLFFQDYIPEAKCEILKPFFVNTNQSTQLPIKEYIETNSAIALALDGLGMVNKNVNFSKGKTASSANKAANPLNKNIDLNTFRELWDKVSGRFKKDFSAPIGSLEKLLMRLGSAGIIAVIMFMIFSNAITNQIEKKSDEIREATEKADTELASIESDISTIESTTSQYNALITEMTTSKEEETDETGEVVITKDSIPNLLNRIMFVIPKKVKLTSISNTTSNHIVIKAEAEKYEQLGYFKAVLTTNGILTNVKSTSGQKTSSVVEVTIEGDLP